MDEPARKIRDYHHLNHQLEPCDIILALGSNDLRVAEYAAELYVQGLAPRLMFSGNVGALTRELFTRPEAEAFAEIAVQRGVPRDRILTECASTSTGENIAFSRRLLESRSLDPGSFILVQKPYMERQAYATFMKQWPGEKVIVSSPPISFSEYPTAVLPKDLVISIMIGDLQRLRLYPALGFQVEQEIPDEVWQAYERLVAPGYDRHLVR